MTEKTQTPPCTCYIDNCRTARDRVNRSITSVVECPRHSTEGLRDLQRRGQEAKRTEG